MFEQIEMIGGSSISLHANELSNGWTSRRSMAMVVLHCGWGKMVILSELELVELCVLGDVL
jgi:hypothetical protein